MRAAGDVGKGLVDGDALDERREVAQHLDRGIAQPLVLLEMAADENELRAELARPPSRHAAVHAEGLGLVGRREHDPAADRDRLAAQRRIEQLLDRGIEGVEIGMEDGGDRVHPDNPPACLGASATGRVAGNIKRTSRRLVKPDFLLKSAGDRCRPWRTPSSIEERVRGIRH